MDTMTRPATTNYQLLVEIESEIYDLEYMVWTTLLYFSYQKLH